MKRLQPTALFADNATELRLRCRPKFDQISSEERSALLSRMRPKAVNSPADESFLEVDFPFTFNENGSILCDSQFSLLTDDDYGDLWIERAVNHFAHVNKHGVLIPDSAEVRLTPSSLLVDPANDEISRHYKIVFLKGNESERIQYSFGVSGGPGNQRVISWDYGSYEASWSQKVWTFKSAPMPNLEDLLISIIRMDEAINLELMPYAVA